MIYNLDLNMGLDVVMRFFALRQALGYFNYNILIIGQVMYMLRSI